MNIQTLIDLLSQEILRYDLSHIRGDQIVSGNPEHCINLLQLAKEISMMMNTNTDPQQEGDDDSNQEEAKELQDMLGEADEDDEAHLIQSSNKKSRKHGDASDEYNSRQ